MNKLTGKNSLKGFVALFLLLGMLTSCGIGQQSGEVTTERYTEGTGVEQTEETSTEAETEEVVDNTLTVAEVKSAMNSNWREVVGSDITFEKGGQNAFGDQIWLADLGSGTIAIAASDGIVKSVSITNVFNVKSVDEEYAAESTIAQLDLLMSHLHITTRKHIMDNLIENMTYEGDTESYSKSHSEYTLDQWQYKIENMRLLDALTITTTMDFIGELPETTKATKTEEPDEEPEEESTAKTLTHSDIIDGINGVLSEAELDEAEFEGPTEDEDGNSIWKGTCADDIYKISITETNGIVTKVTVSSLTVTYDLSSEAFSAVIGFQKALLLSHHPQKTLQKISDGLDDATESDIREGVSGTVTSEYELDPWKYSLNANLIGSRCITTATMEYIGEIPVDEDTAETTKKTEKTEKTETTKTTENTNEAPQTTTTETHVHSYVDHKGKAATCTEKGYGDYKTCSCGYTTYRETAALGHNYDLSDTVNATCEKEGYNLYKCSRCGDSYKETLYSTEHNYTIVKTVDPTCVDEGYNVWKCSLCSDKYKETTKNATGHQYVFKEMKDPTCEKDGYYKYECVDCGDSYKETSEAMGHMWVDVTEEIYHEEVGHYEDVEVSVPVDMYRCPLCSYAQPKYETVDDYYAHFDDVHGDDANSSFHRDRYEVVDGWGYTTEERWVVDKKAYSETVVVGKKCTACGKTK